MLDFFAFLRCLNANNFVHHSQLAQALGAFDVSRMHRLSKDHGITVLSDRAQGYRLPYPIDWLDTKEITAQLPEHSVLHVKTVMITESTQAALRSNPQHGHVLACEWQGHGQGRLGRRWHASLGSGLLFSLAWHYPFTLEKLAGLPLAIGVCVAQSLKKQGASSLSLKWPNDLLCHGRKVGGILCDAMKQAGGSVIVIGIGLNFYTPMVDVGQASTGLCAHGFTHNRNEVLGRLLDVIEHTLEQFSIKGLAAFLPSWEALTVWPDASICLQLPNGKNVEGIAIGLAHNGALRVQTAHGEEQVFSAEFNVSKT